MTDTLWIGSKRMEIFKLWLAAKITLLSRRADDMYWANQVKSVLNSLDDSYLNDNWFVDVEYGLFVNELLDLIEK